MNGQTVLVLDEETASALKDTQSPINVVLQPQKEEETPPNVLFYDPNKNHNDIYDQHGNLVPINLKQEGVTVIPPPKHPNNDDNASDNTSVEPSTSTSTETVSFTASATNTTFSNNVTNTVRTEILN